MYILINDVGPSRATIVAIAGDPHTLAEHPLWDCDKTLVCRARTHGHAAITAGNRIWLDQVRIIDDPHSVL